MRERITRGIGAAALCFLVACGGGGGDGTGGGGGGGGGGGLGPSGTTCTTSSACYGPAGGTSLSCSATVGPNTAVVASDFDYVLNSLNTIRTNLGLTAFVRTAGLDTFAQNASTQLMADNTPHAYFIANAAGDPAFSGGRAENQGSPTGWPTNLTTTQIDEIVSCFMAEETAPAGTVKAHWETIVCPCYVKIGVGLVKDGAGKLFLSIEFSQ